jgi:hypothetical protein
MGWYFLVFIVICVGCWCIWLARSGPYLGSFSTAQLKPDAVEDSPSEITPAPSPPENEGKNIGCYVVIVILLAFLAVAYAAISAVGEALDSFFGGVEDFFNVFENVFKGG